MEGYGLTEGTCVSTINPRVGVRKIGSIGKALPGQEILIVDEQGNEVAHSNAGEIIIKGDNVMKGYFNRPEETAKTIINGYLHTGDVGIKDEDGYIFIVDRKKDMIIRGGENIYPKEIDNLLATHPKISEAATVGVPDKTMGEEVKVFVVAEDDTLTEEEVIEFCKKNLASFKVPKYVEILDEDFPRSPIGKVLKKTLRDWGMRATPKEPRGRRSPWPISSAPWSPASIPEGVKGINSQLRLYHHRHRRRRIDRLRGRRHRQGRGRHPRPQCHHHRRGQGLDRHHPGQARRHDRLYLGQAQSRRRSRPAHQSHHLL